MTYETVTEAITRIRGALTGLHDPDIGGCVTLVADRTTDQVLRAFGADPAAPSVVRDDLDPEDPAVAVQTVPGGVMAVEAEYGWHGASTPVLVRASRGGRAAAVSWSDMGDTRIGFAVDGQLSPSTTDLLDVEELSADPTVAALLHDLDLDDYDDDVRYRAVLLLERWTGVTADAAPAPSPAAVHRFDPPVEVPEAEVDDYSELFAFRLRSLTYDIDPDQELAAAIERARPGAQRALAGWVTRLVLERGGLSEHPKLAAAIDTLDDPAGPVLDEPAKRCLARLQKVPADQPYGLPAMAARVLVRAAQPHPGIAAVESVWYAYVALERSGEAPAMHAEALRRISAGSTSG
ncbi:hypothetical protein [Pseudonocardia cypriaca]|uniref:Uncharacterized protein n=1 Tax=Pseudonocardia cypriaca TaxID=882449 RepID=A0A543GA93_9PSEU|nr:hypothetical protein [Pseudonocardia cypriaca]TQM42894.1 hypothetical protein FB388_0230 [Pseudonocardia cypriaca]